MARKKPELVSANITRTAHEYGKMLAMAAGIEVWELLTVLVMNKVFELEQTKRAFGISPFWGGVDEVLFKAILDLDAEQITVDEFERIGKEIRNAWTKTKK